MYGLYFSHGDQRFEHWTLQDHVAPHCTSDLLYKGALADTSQALYYGTIRIRPDAFRSDAYQANRNLALSPHARALPNPRSRSRTTTSAARTARPSDRSTTSTCSTCSRAASRWRKRDDSIVFGFFNQVLDKVDVVGDAGPAGRSDPSEDGGVS